MIMDKVLIELRGDGYEGVSIVVMINKRDFCV